MIDEKQKIYLANALEYLLTDMCMTVDEVCEVTGMSREELQEYLGDDLENYESIE